MKRSPLNRRAPLRPRSKRTAHAYAKSGGRRDLVAQLLAERPRCEGRVVCRGARAVDVHERLSRARGGNILDPDQAHMVTLCRACHDWVGANVAEAEARQLLLHSWHKCPPIGPC